MRERFDREYIRSELERLGNQLEAPLTVYLIGGGSMAFRDLKETTKDIDLVVTDGDALRQLQGALLACGYEIVRDLGEEYDELGAQRILENDDGCRIDVFNRQVVDKFILSEGMRERSEAYLNAGRLTVALVSAETFSCSSRSPAALTTSTTCSHWRRRGWTSTSSRRNSSGRSTSSDRSCSSRT